MGKRKGSQTVAREPAEYLLIGGPKNGAYHLTAFPTPALFVAARVGDSSRITRFRYEFRVFNWGEHKVPVYVWDEMNDDDALAACVQMLRSE